jgi:hypothetical protein
MGAATQKPPTISPLKNQEPFYDCGCRFARAAKAAGKNGPYVFAASIDGPAWVNLGGADLRVPPAGQTSCAAERLAEKCSWTYRDGGVHVTLSAAVTRVCPPTDESCESATMRGTLTAESQGQTFTAEVEGVCGC